MYLLDIFGLSIEFSVTFEIKMPEDKVQHTLRLIERVLALRKVTLKEKQSLMGSLAFCAKAMPSV